MKIEKVNENQIRCTLSREELEDRQIKLSELAYGSEKAKSLFHDMIQQANYEFGFEVEDIPLMVEAIPLSGENIILQITKVEYPEELDTRFSKFSESDEEDEEAVISEGAIFPKTQGADDILDIFKKIRKDADAAKEEPEQMIKESKPEEIKADTDIVKMFEFMNLEGLERLARVLSDFYSGENQVYKDMQRNRYYLFLHKGVHTPEDFNKVCNITSEYAVQKRYTPATEAYLKEHGKTILKEHALQILNSL